MTIEIRRGRGCRAHRAERRREDDARKRHDGLRSPDRRLVSSKHATSPAGDPTAVAAPDSRARFSTAIRSETSGYARTSKSRRLGIGAAPREARRRALELLDLLGIAERADSPASLLPHGEERKLEVARARRPSRASYSWMSRRPGFPRPRSRLCACAWHGSRRARCRRAPDRPQHGARHGGVRSDPCA